MNKINRKPRNEEMYKAMISKGRLDNRPCLKWRPVKDKL